MDDTQDIWEVLNSFQNSLKLIQERVDAMDNSKNEVTDRLNSLESILFDDIINPAKMAMDEADKQARYDAFYGKFGEKLDSYNDSLKAIEGQDDFSLAQQAFDGYDAIEGEKPLDDEYVDALIAKVEKQLDDIRTSLGAPSTADVTVTSEEEGEVEVEVDGEPVTEETVVEEEPATEEMTDDAIGKDDEPITEEEKPVELDEYGEPVSDPKALEAFRKELEAARSKM